MPSNGRAEMGRRHIKALGWGLVGFALTACTDGGEPPMEEVSASSGSIDDDDEPPAATDEGTAPTAGTAGGSDDDSTTGRPGDDADSSGDAPPDDETGTTGEPALDVFEEIDGIVAVEAEHAFEIDPNGTERLWYVFTADDQPTVEPDPDPPHWDSASGQSCLEGLPDTRVTHDDELVGGVNFYGSPGDGPILRYRVWINEPGRYWVRVRAYSTGSEDNGVHVGLDGEWPASGARIQWCDGKNQWTWSGAQRTDANHCGEANMIFLDIDDPGEHEIAFSMREDGFEMDKWMLTNDSSVFPEGTGPDEVPYEG